MSPDRMARLIKHLEKRVRVLEDRLEQAEIE